MSLVARPALNHPQQVSGNDRRWHATDVIDDRAVTPADFAEFHARFAFTVDACASEQNARLPRYWTRERSALTQTWAGERVWCNPPYSNIRPFVEKAWREWTHTRDYGSPKGSGPALIVMLLPANRTEQAWWQDLVEPQLRGNCRTFHVEFLRGRMRFLKPGDTEIPPNSRPPFGCCLLIWGDS